MSTPSTQRVALVTGGSGGIGRVVAERLAKDGAAVGVHYAGNKAKAEDTVGAITAAGGAALAVGGDVADEQAMCEPFDSVESAFGGVPVAPSSTSRPRWCEPSCRPTAPTWRARPRSRG